MINLPKLFEERLKESPSLFADVRKSLDFFEPWLEQSGMPFFPGFTDHSPRHINDVLNTASALISDEAHEFLSPEDVAVLTLAVLLHDCGMHLTQDGFRTLVSGSWTAPISGLGDLPWDQLWLDFLGEAQRFGEDRLFAVFGDTQAVIVKNLDITSLSERDCLLIGEFVRRHHARLAHEIAIIGVPFQGTQRLQLVGLDDHLKDLSGLIARSHGMSIRSTFPYLEERFGRIAEHRKVKAPFLMAVLRIADYVQVQSERALKSLLSVKELRSPVSRQEWRNHFSVSDVTMRHEDPEAMYVHATPTDVKTYLRLEALFKDIQKELDESWATLGEVYGRLGELSALGLTIRRLRSNLDNRERLATALPYIPIKAGFQSSGPDLLKLLVGPLYDYQYGVGIRELVQNAVDACRERADLQHSATASDQEDVLVEIEEVPDGTGWITVTDAGVGMTQDTVTKYFLVAGASFRNSDVWKKQHTDSDGFTRVLRGGRFGIGALAAFLLGDEIQVRTRHCARDESEGLIFSARMDDPIVELRHCMAPAGTQIKIRVTQADIMSSLRPLRTYETPSLKAGILSIEKWEAIDWFAQLSPRVLYKWSGFLETPNKTDEKQRAHGEFRPRTGLVPHGTEKGDWMEVADPEPYTQVLWQFPKPTKEKFGQTEYTILPARGIVVNGIRVTTVRPDTETGTLNLEDDDVEGPQFLIERPALAIFDPAGRCPINLQRSAVSFDRMGIDAKLAESIFDNYLGKIVQMTPDKLSFKSYASFCSELRALSGVSYTRPFSPVCATSEGFFLAAPSVFHELRIQTLFIVNARAHPDVELRKMLKEGEAILIRSKMTEGEQSTLGWFRALFSLKERYPFGSDLPHIERLVAVGHIAKNTWGLATARGKVSQALIRRVKLLRSGKEMVWAARCGTETEALDLVGRIETVFTAYDGPYEIGAWSLASDWTSDDAPKPSLLDRKWRQHVGSPLLKTRSRGGAR